MASMEQIYVRRTAIEVIGQVFHPLSSAFDGGELIGPLCEMLILWFLLFCALFASFSSFFATNYKLNISDKFRGVQGFT